MANNVVGPWEVDSELTAAFGFGAIVLPNAETLTLIGPSELAAVAGGHGMINGFASARTLENKKMLVERGAAVRRRQRRPLPRPPIWARPRCSSRASTGPLSRCRSRIILTHRRISYTDHRPHRREVDRGAVLHRPWPVRVDAAGAGDRGPRPGAGAGGKTIEMQGPVIDAASGRPIRPSSPISRSTRPDCWRARCRCPTRRPRPSRTRRTSRRGALHFQSDPVRSSKLFDDTGMDLVAMAKTNVYQTADAEGAAEDRRRVLRRAGADVAAGQPGERTCRTAAAWQLEDKAFYCLATADRYAIETSGANLLDTQQQIAAQYVMLMSG